MKSPERIDREEDRRVNAMRREARIRPHLSFGERPHTKRALRSGLMFFPGNKVLGYSSPHALGDAVRANIEREEARRAMQGTCRVLVKHGEWQVPVEERPPGWERWNVKSPETL